MMRSGWLGLAVGLFSLVVIVAANVVFARWVLRRFKVSKRGLIAILVVLSLLSPLGRILNGAGFSDHFAWLEAIGQLWGLTLLAALPVIALFDWILGRTAKQVSPERRETLARIGGGVAIAAAAVPLARGVYKRFDYDVVELPIRIAKLPRTLDGFTIAQISDIHIGVYLGERELRRAEDTIASFKADLVVMTGDLVHLRPEYLPRGIDWVRRLGTRARHGSLSILGNHEYYVGRAAVLEGFRRAGLPMLVNESRIIDGIGFGAVDDHFARSRGAEGPNFDAALAGLPVDGPRILLCHQPQAFGEVAGRIDLQLSGHTHGGQIGPIGPVVASALYRGRCAGLYRSEGSALYVNRGFGTSGPPSRVAVRPEITKIVLLSA